MDFITDLPLSIKLGVKILLITRDRLNNGVILIPILLISAPAVAMAFMERYIPYHGFSKAIINDRGTQFTSAVWATICGMLGIERRLFLVYSGLTKVKCAFFLTPLSTKISMQTSLHIHKPQNHYSF